mmetsp:Transcript_52135/g.127291  ORF Transcript_52135/g.127291 Transcript_52135/m.127291 type:complete len:533 (+) Transcript_52135:155-1753(+)
MMEHVAGKYLERGAEDEVEPLIESGGRGDPDYVPARGGHAPSPSAPDLETAQRQWDGRGDSSDPSAPPLMTSENVEAFTGSAGNVDVGPRGKKLARAESNPRMMRGSDVSFASFSSMRELVDTYYGEGSIKGSVFNLCSATLGAGCLSVPFAFKGTGIAAGFILLVGVAIATSFSVHLIIKTRQRSGLRNYGEIGEGVFGTTAGMFVEFSVVIFCFGTGVAYCKTLRDILIPVLATAPKAFTNNVTDKQAMVALWVVALLPLSLIKTLASLRFSSLFGVASTVYVSLTVTIHALIGIGNGKIKPKWHHPDLWFAGEGKDLLLALPIYLFAFTCQVNVLDVWDDLARASSRRMDKVTRRSMVLCLIIYGLVGAFGFLEFGSKTCGNILQSYEDELENGSVGIIFMYVFIALTLLMAFPLVVLPCRASLMSLTTRAFGCSGGHIFWTLMVAGGALAISLWVDDVREVFQLVGASSSALVCFVFPPGAALRLNILTGSEKYAAWMLLIGGALVGILGTAATLQNILKPEKEPFCT